MSTVQIRQLLDERLLNVPSLPPLQAENTRFDRTGNGAASVRSTLLPSDSAPLGLGVDGGRIIKGIYQVDVFQLVDTGFDAPHSLADAIVDAFPVGSRLIGDSIVVNVNEPASVAPGYVTGVKWYVVPVRVPWVVYKN